MPERTARKVAQLAEGIEGAAAALPAQHASLGERAAAAAARASSAAAAAARASSAADAPATDRLDEILRCMERLHYALLRIDVLEEGPEETGVEERLAALEALLPAGTAGGAADALDDRP